MLRRIESLWGTPVASLQTGATIAYLDLPIINPKNLKIVAFYLSGGKYTGMMLDVNDIREVTNRIVVINHEDLVTEPDDFIKIAPLINSPYEIFNKCVYNQNDKKIGKVKSYTVNDGDFKIIRLDVAPRLSVGLLDIARVVPREAIIEVAKNYIKINDDTKVKSKIGSKQIAATASA